MGNPVYRVYTVAGTTPGPQEPVNLDWLTDGSLTIGVWLAGAGSYSIEGTLDDVVPPSQGGQRGASDPARWFTLDEFPVGTAVSKYAGIYNPWLYIRLNIASIGANIEFKLQHALNIYRL